MDLGAWNERLAEHYGALARDRKDTDIPLFALEHGLAPAETLALSEELRAHIRVSPPVRDHALAWTVYAAEIGYGYAGDEYWQTFEEETPGWTTHGDRGWIRRAFVSFRKTFAGAEPSGAWANHFSIICWPITHAILPRDLQQQLAWVLYDLRHSFSAELFDTPTLLGEFIAARSWNTSARFQNLTQQPALVGQIAAALLLQGEKGLNTLLHPMTLKRIGDDVDRERRGRDWLRSARRAAEERANIRGLAIGRPTNTPIHRAEEAREEVIKLGIEPRLVLRPIETDGSCWEVSLEIPDLSHLLLRFPQFREALTQSRCTVAGAVGRPLARGRCLHGPQRVALSRWPRPEEVLLQFEHTEPQLDFLLRAECMLRPGASWLFRVASDGLGYESRGMRVRADSTYLLVSTEPIPRSDVARHVETTCQGVYAVLLPVPSALTPLWEQTLRLFQITQAKSIEVWPAGLAAVTWDGEGNGEWLASETPTIAIRSDHPIDQLTIAMSQGGPSLSLALTDASPGEPVFVELPPLAIGLHKFSVAARYGSGAHSDVIGDLDVVMRVREARPWSPGAAARGPLDVELDPAAPSLEQLWEGKVSVLVRGPAGRQLKCRVRMFKRLGVGPSFQRQLPALKLPLVNEEWTRHFEADLKKQKDAQRAYDDANVCEIEFSAEELGVFTLRCEREFTPLRWSVTRDAFGFIPKLHDDTGKGVPVIERYSFERPTLVERQPEWSHPTVARAGGLYTATLDNFNASIIVPPMVKGLEDLQCVPLIEERDRSPESISRLMSVARLWRSARLSGDLLAGMRQRTVLHAIATQILALLGGEKWERAEAQLSRPTGLAELKRSISPNRLEAGIGAKLLLDCATLGNTLPRARAAILASLMEAFRVVTPNRQRETIRITSASGVTVRRQVEGVGPEHSIWFAEFALRMASDPATTAAWAGEHADSAIKKLLTVPTLARAARFMVLAVDQCSASGPSAGEIYAGWEWSS